jgi:branched-chain amino acid transport system substrate-binding protein
MFVPVLAAGVLLAACSSSSQSESPTTAKAAPTTTAKAESTSAATSAAPSESSAAAPQTTAATAAPTECGEPAAGDPIKVGTLEVASGPAVITGTSAGLRAYFEAYNECGGYDGRPLELIALDGAQDPQLIASGARQMVDQGIVAMAGTTNAADCIVNGEYYTQQNLPVLSIGLTPPCYTSPTIFVTNMGSDSLVPAAVWASQQQGRKKIAFLGFDIPGIRDQAKFINEYLGKQGEALIFEEYLPLDGSGDIPGLVTRMAQTKPDAVITVFSEQILTSMLDLAATQGAGISSETIWIGATGLYGEKAMGVLAGQAEGLYILSPFFPYDGDEPETVKMVAAMEKYQPDFPLDGFVQMGWNAGIALEAALETLQGAEPTKEALLDAIKANGGLENSLYPATIDWSTLPQKPPAAGYIVKVAGDEFVLESDLISAE